MSFARLRSTEGQENGGKTTNWVAPAREFHWDAREVHRPAGLPDKEDGCTGERTFTVTRGTSRADEENHPKFGLQKEFLFQFYEQLFQSEIQTLNNRTLNLWISKYKIMQKCWIKFRVSKLWFRWGCEQKTAKNKSPKICENKLRRCDNSPQKNDCTQ